MSESGESKQGFDVSLKSRSPVIIVGMHRSGTSLLTHILAEMGLYIGNQLDKHNESVLFKGINNRLLLEVGASWFRPEPFLTKLNQEGFVQNQAERAFRWVEEGIGQYGQVRPEQGWGWKDPRNTLTLPVWLHVFPNAKVINIERHGIDVSLSLQRREIKRIPYQVFGRAKEKGMFPPTIKTAYELWCLHLRIVEGLHNQCFKWMSIRYEDLLSNPKTSIVDLQEYLDLDVMPSKVEWIVEQVVRHPTPRSSLDSLRLRILINLGLLDLQPLYERGYKVFD